MLGGAPDWTKDKDNEVSITSLCIKLRNTNENTRMKCRACYFASFRKSQLCPIKAAADVVLRKQKSGVG